MNSADLLVVLFVLAAACVLAGFAISAIVEVQAWRRCDKAIDRLARQRQAPLGVRGKIRGYDIMERR